MTEGTMTVTFEPGLENEFETFKCQWFASVYEGISGGEGGGLRTSVPKESISVLFPHALKGMILWQELQSTNLCSWFNLVIKKKKKYRVG